MGNNIPSYLYECYRNEHCWRKLLSGLADTFINLIFAGCLVLAVGGLFLCIGFAIFLCVHGNDKEKTSTSDPPFQKSTSKSTSVSRPLSLLIPTPPPLIASQHSHDRKPHLLLCATGSVATIKIPSILRSLSSHNLSIRLILSPSALTFLSGQSSEQPSAFTLLSSIPNLEAIYVDEDEWLRPWKRGDPILHIELRRWADLMVIAPLSANAMAGLCHGFSGSLIGSVCRAWDVKGLIDSEREGVRWPCEGAGGRRKKGIIVAPAMNTAMWHHPVTREQMSRLEGEWNVQREGGWVEVLRPVEKELACGDTGSGAMRQWEEIVEVIEDRLDLTTKKAEE